MAEQLEVPLSVSIDVSAEKKKPRLLSILFCDYTNITNDNKPNLLGIFDRIYVDPETRRTPNFILSVRVAEVLRAFDITMFGPDEKPAMEIKSIPQQVAYTEGLPQQVQTAIILGFEVKTPGVFWFDISYDGMSLGGAGLVIEYRATEDKHSGTDTYV